MFSGGATCEYSHVSKLPPPQNERDNPPRKSGKRIEREVRKSRRDLSALGHIYTTYMIVQCILSFSHDGLINFIMGRKLLQTVTGIGSRKGDDVFGGGLIIMPFAK